MVINARSMVVMKAVVVATFWMFPWMFTFANWALSWIQSDEAQLIIVMLIVPSKSHHMPID